jgi:KEOPS complex subunit Cgi121
LLKFIEEFGRHVEITGFKDVVLRNFESFLLEIGEQRPLDVDVQFFDSDRVATWEHLYFAVVNALTVFRNRENISKSLSMETLLYAAAEKQIVKATELVGIKSTSRRIAAVVIGKQPERIRSTLLVISECLDRQPEESVLELSEDKMLLIQKIFNVKSMELETVKENNDVKKALVDLVIERMALSTTRR